MSKLYVSNFRIYKTDGENAQAAYSAGIAVASKLNGDNMLVGSFNPNREEATPRKIGFITFREKFDNKEAADAFKEANKRKYLIGSSLDDKKWAWGEIDEEGTVLVQESSSGNAEVHFVDYIGGEKVVAKVETTAEEAAE